MSTLYRLFHGLAVQTFVLSFMAPVHTWGQTQPVSSPEGFQEQRVSPSDRVGSVLDFSGRVQHQKHTDQRWQSINIEQLLLHQDRVRTGEQSKVSVQLLRQREVKTIEARTEAQFSSKDPQCKFTKPLPQSESQVIELTLDLIHVIGKIIAVHTPNAVICVEGTTALVHFTTAPDTTEVITLVGHVTVWNQKADPADPQKITLEKSVTLQTNSRVLVVGPRHDSQFALLEELWREGPPPLPRDAHVVFLERRRNDELQPPIGSDPQTRSLTPDTSPAGVKFLQNSLLSINVLFPR